MILEHEGRLFELKASNCVISVTLPIKNKKLSGDTSSTLTTSEGSKAKVLSVACVIAFEDGEHLTELMTLAEATETSGKRRVYRIQQEDAQVADIREVIFDGNFSYRKTEGLLAWSVTFSLLQYNSVAEAKEMKQQQRQANRAATSDSALGNPVAATNPTEPENLNKEPINKQLNQFEKLLKKIDKMLEPDSDNENHQNLQT
jgi:hypothetical protein